MKHTKYTNYKQNDTQIHTKPKPKIKYHIAKHKARTIIQTKLKQSTTQKQSLIINPK